MALEGKDGSFWSATNATSLITDADFEAGTLAAWTNGTIESTTIYEGAYAASVTNETLSQASSAASVAENDYVVLSAMVKASGTPSATASLVLDCESAANASLATATATVPIATTGWTRFAVIKKAPATTDHISVEFTAGAGDTYYIDDVRCYKMEQVGGFSSWSIDSSYDTHDSSAFEDAGWRTFVAGLKQWSASATQYWASSDMFTALDAQEPIYCMFYVEQDSDMTGKRFEGMAHVNGLSVKAGVDTVVTGDVTMQGNTDLAYSSD